MTRYITNILILLVITSRLFGQLEVHGKVMDYDGTPLPGVSIIGLTSKTGTISDTNGLFKIIVPYDTSCINLSFVGYMDTTICQINDTLEPIYLLPDLRPIDDIIGCCIDYSYRDNIMFGYFGGVLHNPYGIAISNFTSYLFNFPLMTVAQFEYRSDFMKNSDLHFGLARYHGRDFKDFHFGLSYEFDKLRIDDNEAKLNYQAHKFNTTWNYKKTYFFAGYGYSEINNEFYNGILTSLSTDIPKINIGLLARFNYWYDYSELSIDLYKTIPKTNINLSLGYEQLYTYKEINVRIRYEIDY